MRAILGESYESMTYQIPMRIVNTVYKLEKYCIDHLVSALYEWCTYRFMFTLISHAFTMICYLYNQPMKITYGDPEWCTQFSSVERY